MAKQETQSQKRSIALLVAREKTAGGNGRESPDKRPEWLAHRREDKGKATEPADNASIRSSRTSAYESRKQRSKRKRRSLS